MNALGARLAVGAMGVGLAGMVGAMSYAHGREAEERELDRPQDPHVMRDSMSAGAGIGATFVGIPLLLGSIALLANRPPALAIAMVPASLAIGAGVGAGFGALFGAGRISAR